MMHNLDSSHSFKRAGVNTAMAVAVAIASVSFSNMASAADYIEPPMVSIPAGDFIMGSDRGDADELPTRKVSVPAFQMGKYEVTFAEFAKFIEATNYEMPDNCYQYVLGGPRQELASWDTVVYRFTEYHPVACLPQKAAVDYAKWLSAQTGKNYRLPTEAEWEYTVRAGTSSRHFFGSDAETYKSCDYANISEWYAKDKSDEIFEGARVRDVEECSDNEATLSVVGLYKPNPFGVYDMVGNLMEYLDDCYVDNYENAPTDGSAVVKENCEAFVVRGGSWHWYPWYSSQRGRISNDFLGALEGFRLVLDTDGKALPAQQGSRDFVAALTKAQNEAKAQHRKNAPYPRKPAGLRVTSASKSQVTLNWQENQESFLSGYVVYRQDPMTNTTKAVSKVINTTTFVDTSPLAHNARYHVVALNGKTESMASNVVDSGIVTTHVLPTKIEGESHSLADGANVIFSSLEPEEDKTILSMDDKPASYQVKVNKSGRFQINARVFHSGDEQQFDVWLGDQKLQSSTISGERGWKTLNEVVVELPAGTHTLTFNGEKPLFAINWLDVKAL